MFSVFVFSLNILKVVVIYSLSGTFINWGLFEFYLGCFTFFHWENCEFMIIRTWWVFCLLLFFSFFSFLLFLAVLGFWTQDLLLAKKIVLHWATVPAIPSYVFIFLSGANLGPRILLPMAPGSSPHLVEWRGSSQGACGHNTCVIQCFQLCEIYPRKLNEVGKAYLGSQTQRCQSMVNWLHCLCPKVKQDIMAGKMR
jgi:hypothetical protein